LGKTFENIKTGYEFYFDDDDQHNKQHIIYQ